MEKSFGQKGYVTHFDPFMRHYLTAKTGEISVTTSELRQALLQGGSPATPEELHQRFDALISERGKGKDASKLRFVIE
jgi:hypothetical protein